MIFVCRSASLAFQYTSLKETGQKSVTLEDITIETSLTSSQHYDLKEIRVGRNVSAPPHQMYARLTARTRPKGHQSEDYIKFPNALLSSQLILLICARGDQFIPIVHFIHLALKRELTIQDTEQLAPKWKPRRDS
jgi:protease II